MRPTILVLSLFLAGCSSIPPARTTDPARVETARVPILLYHHIQDLPSDASDSLRRWTLTPDQFVEHMEWVAQQGFDVITMAQMNEHLKHGTPLPAHPIILTFDDGWKDNYTAVLPILRKYRFPATFFITTESVGHSAFVTWEELKVMSEAGMDIQAHSVTHPHLTKLKDAAVRREIEDSKKAIESPLGTAVVVFAYPFGSYSEKIISMVKDAGYESATIVSGSNLGYLYREDRSYTLSRIAIEGDMTLEDLAQNVEDMKENHVSY
jgi:peptidoglycan/xylan/chitin deacetylase (PgdA/CDA1 family)